ncbi:hypothetical protein HMPREF3050_00070 [Neisseria sp. HMSC065D04]|nr:hypothetical protein HMPREF3050_00070 [Neisseria sp. HMSC065D04]
MVEAQPVEKANPEPAEEAPKPTLTEEQFAALVEAVSTGVKEVSDVLENYNLTDEQKAEINAL